VADLEADTLDYANALGRAFLKSGWGTLILTFQEGECVLAEDRQTRKPPVFPPLKEASQ
jgi:hypothetical protein